jgi:hypothetical protein
MKDELHAHVTDGQIARLACVGAMHAQRGAGAVWAAGRLAGGMRLDAEGRGMRLHTITMAKPGRVNVP